MQHRSYVPGPPLSAFVEDFWLYEDYRPRHLRERILPSGTIELVINLRDDELRIYDRVRPGACERFPGAVVSGTYDRFFVIDTAEEASLVGVHFRAGGASPFFGLPASELANTHVALEALWGRAGRELRERLQHATRPIDKFGLVEAALRQRLVGLTGPRAAVRLALQELSRSSLTTVHDVTRQVGLSHRRFVEVFKAEVGLTPKRYQRVQRFQRVVSRAQRMPEPEWSALALDGGFYDQSHLIHDVVEFTGFTPAELARHLERLRRRGVHLKRHHLPLPGEPLVGEGQVSPIPAGRRGRG